MAIGLRVTEHELASFKFGHQYCFVAAYVYIYMYRHAQHSARNCLGEVSSKIVSGGAASDRASAFSVVRNEFVDRVQDFWCCVRMCSQLL